MNPIFQVLTNLIPKTTRPKLLIGLENNVILLVQDPIVSLKNNQDHLTSTFLLNLDLLAEKEQLLRMWKAQEKVNMRASLRSSWDHQKTCRSNRCKKVVWKVPRARMNRFERDIFWLYILIKELIIELNMANQYLLMKSSYSGQLSFLGRNYSVSLIVKATFSTIFLSSAIYCKLSAFLWYSFKVYSSSINLSKT